VPLPKLVHTSSFRLTLLYAALFSLSALILLGVIYGATTYYMTGTIDAAIESDVTELKQALSENGRDRLIVLVEERIQQMPNGPIFYLLEDAAGNSLAGNLPAIGPRTGAFDLNVPSLAPPSERHIAIHIHSVKLTTGDDLMVGADATQLVELKELILSSFGWCFAITLLLAVGGGVVMSGSILRRIESVNRTSRDIMAGNLSRRIPLAGTNDEFDRLAESLNAMLDRTERSLEGMRQVSNDIAHDLRTPLTRLRHRLEFAQRKCQSADELRSAIDHSITETDAILDTFGALLWIAQLEGQGSQRPFVAIDLSELLATVAEVYQSTAEQKAQRILVAAEAALTVSGDRELLTQLFCNLVENAVRHSPSGASIEIGAADRDGVVEVWIADNGPGIPQEARAKVFQRFYRLEASRTTSGNGLGLSLVAAIAALHRIDLALADNAPGLRVLLRFAPAQ
jgi:signal transduction histidine kinase